MFIQQMQVGQMAVFAYLVGDTVTGDALVIDPADNAHEILAMAAKNNLRINYIVNTHGHVDHIGGNAEMKKLTGAKIIVHEDDAIMLTSTPAMMLKMFGAKQSPPPDLLVQDGQIIAVGNVELKVIHTPGHSPGGMCLYTARLRLHWRHAVCGSRRPHGFTRRFLANHVQRDQDKAFCTAG